MKTILEGLVVAVEDYTDANNKDIKFRVVFETKRKVTESFEAKDWIKAKSLIKPSQLNQVLRFEVEAFHIPDGKFVKTYYRLLKEVK